ncbi:uncharacterized protein LOC143222057 [Tachypleus tridentatus]|uniref:uncharacterized protein LOC143222057 n=1 Tax=Tachypleus tridentatus TaxID=6853 RepID=UPI003FD0684B
MKLLLASLVVVVSLTLTKSDAIDAAWKKLCEINEKKPEKMNEIKDCDGKFLSGKSEMLLAEIRKCEKRIFPTNNFAEFLSETCSEGREADLKKVKECIREKFAASQMDSEKVVVEMMNNCF